MPESMALRGTRTAFELAGHGPALLMLHGAEGSRRQFATIRAHLQSHFTVLTYDQRDCGDTHNPEVPATLADLADDAQALMAALGIPRAHVFGTSLGGRVAQTLALRHPAAIDHLVLSSTWPLPVDLAAENPEAVAATAQLRAGLPATAEQLAGYFYPAHHLAAHPQARQHFAAAPPRSARSERRFLTARDMPALDPSHIAAPTLVIAGALDALVPAQLSLALSRSIPGARTAILPEVGHLGVAQAPEAVARLVIDFATGTPA